MRPSDHHQVPCSAATWTESRTGVDLPIFRRRHPRSRRVSLITPLPRYGLIRRIEHTPTYVLTPEGQRLAVLYTELDNRLLRPLAAADQPQAPPALRQALTVIDHHVEDYIARARLKSAARKH